MKKATVIYMTCNMWRDIIGDDSMLVAVVQAALGAADEAVFMQNLFADSAYADGQEIGGFEFESEDLYERIEDTWESVNDSTAFIVRSGYIDLMTGEVCKDPVMIVEFIDDQYEVSGIDDTGRLQLINHHGHRKYGDPMGEIASYEDAIAEFKRLTNA